MSPGFETWKPYHLAIKNVLFFAEMPQNSSFQVFAVVRQWEDGISPMPGGGFKGILRELGAGS